MIFNAIPAEVEKEIRCQKNVTNIADLLLYIQYSLENIAFYLQSSYEEFSTNRFFTLYNECAANEMDFKKIILKIKQKNIDEFEKMDQISYPTINGTDTINTESVIYGDLLHTLADKKFEGSQHNTLNAFIQKSIILEPKIYIN